MSPQIHNRVRALFDEALKWPEAETLPRLEHACSGEPEVLAAVVRLLNAHRKSGSFLQDSAPPIQCISRYIVIGELGRGGMGVVYDAMDPVIGRKVAVKVIRIQPFTHAGEVQFLRERLFREARLAGVLSHPGIVTVFDVGLEGDLAFIAMERVEGLSLDRVLASGRRFSRDQLIHLLKQVATALDYAHLNGVVHRDVKPANIILDSSMNARIADFGIAKVIYAQSHTLTGMMIGTPLYMSPEQIEALPSDGRSDQFSLAVLAYEILTGTRPFYADTLAALAHMIVYSDRPSARAANPDLPLAVDLVFRRGLARFPNERYATCSEFVGALSKTLEEPGIQPHGATPLPEPPRFEAYDPGVGTPRIKVVGASVGAVLLTCVLVYFLWFPKPPVTADLSQGTVPRSTSAPKSRAVAPPRSKDKPDKSAKAPNSGKSVWVPSWLPLNNGASSGGVTGQVRRQSVSTAPNPISPSAQKATLDTHGVMLPPLDSLDDILVSHQGGVAALIEFVNRSGLPVDIYWINYEGRRVRYAYLDPGARYLQPTVLGHPWIVVASGTSGAVAKATGTRLAAFEPVTPNPTGDQGIRDIAIITSPGVATQNRPSLRRESGAKLAGTTKVNPKDGLTYVWVPPGIFMMGCSPGDVECDNNEKPAHQVTIVRGLWIGQTPVTQAAYERVTGKNPSRFKGPNLPVEMVNWDEALAYCVAIGGRLPTEAEWEYAARAGTAVARYADLDQIAWYSRNSGGKAHDVAEKQPNAFMLYDMLGNVSQWVADWYGDYAAGTEMDPSGPAIGQDRTLRGGFWGNDPRFVRASDRRLGKPSMRGEISGVRCAED